jgi:CARDB
MKRLALALITVGLVASLASGASGADPRAKLRGFVCQTALYPANRGIAVTSVMRPLAHTMHMAVRFQLLERQSKSGPALPVVYGDLGKWIYPKDRTLGQRAGDQFIVPKQISDLSAPAYYRFKVSFRWIGAHNHVIGTAVRSTPLCFQPELRPDLLVKSITVKPDQQNLSRDIYVARIRNAGATAAGPFAVQFAANGHTRDKAIQRLGPHSGQTVTFLGPLCNSSSPPAITVDPDNQVPADLNRANNTLTATCPAP